MESTATLFGHPIHSMLIPFPLALLGMTVIFDLLATFREPAVLGQGLRR